SAERWRSRARTATAMAALGAARFVVATLPFDRWRGRLGWPGKVDDEVDRIRARRFAARVGWAARLLPFPTKCLPPAMALSWMQRRRGIGPVVVFAVRPQDQRSSHDELHAWVEIGGAKIIGDLPGPWVETLRLGQ